MPVVRFKQGDAVLIEWEDSYGCSSSWQDLPDGGEPETMVCRSLGWVSRLSKRSVVIVPHIGHNERMGVKQGCGDMTIPIAAIVRARKIKAP